MTFQNPLSSLIFVMTFRVKSALHFKSGANDGDVPLKQNFPLFRVNRFAASSFWKRFSCKMIDIHGIMQIFQGNMRSSNTAHTLAINCRNWRGADGRWSCLHRTIFCHVWVETAPRAPFFQFPLWPVLCGLNLAALHKGNVLETEIF